MWRHPRHTPLVFLHQGQLCPWSSHCRQRRALHVGKRQRARQVPLTSCERRSDKSQLAAYLTHERKPAPAEIRLRSHQARSGGKTTPVAPSRFGGKPTPVAPSPLRRKAHSGRTKPTLVALSNGKPTPVAPRLYISVSPTLRGPARNKTFSFVTR